jgi:alpha-D-xyloside xylohydrolase
MDAGGFVTFREKRRSQGWGMNKNPEPFRFRQGDFEEPAPDPGCRELCLRRLQPGCFLPIFRSHGTNTPREIRNFRGPGESFYEAGESFIRLGCRLMYAKPYTL